ncbi:FMN-binding protein [Microbacterium sp. SS28]|uniref:FMN-binding protein n=1 Tax=Microbacterium sp. SS28 TaxID=2919948 RepID=UPI001FAA1F3E|nr:FMN-binding protein [Microbacterium sp. SS28]
MISPHPLRGHSIQRIRTTALPRPLRTGAALVGVAGIIALAGCSAADSPSSADTGDTGSSTTGGTTDTGASATYTNGTYEAEGAYQTPESVETISVTVTLEDDIITAVEVTGDPSARESEEYQAKFIGGISDAVVGQDIDEISVSRVAGSSLTSGGFNQAIQQIKSEAAA